MSVGTPRRECTVVVYVVVVEVFSEPCSILRERERESLRFKEEEDGARARISIKISFTNLSFVSYVNTQIFLKI